MGITITWQLVLSWILSVLVVNVIINVISHYVAKTSDTQLAKLFSWLKQQQEHEQEIIDSVTTVMNKPEVYTIFQQNFLIIYATRLVTIIGILTVIGQIISILPIIDSLYRTIALVLLLVILILFSVHPFTVFRRYKKIEAAFSEKQVQEAETMIKEYEKEIYGELYAKKLTKNTLKETQSDSMS